jgi:hypothetical protein
MSSSPSSPQSRATTPPPLNAFSQLTGQREEETSAVWVEGKGVPARQCTEIEQGSGKVRCKYCSREYLTQSDLPTSNIRDHLKRRHPAKLDELKRKEALEKAEVKTEQEKKESRQPKVTTLLPAATTSPTNTVPLFILNRSRKRQVTASLLSVSAEMNIPFRSLTESNSFRKMMRDAIGWQVPSRFTIARLLPRYYHQCREVLRLSLTKIDSISITTDSTFLTRHEVPYIAITGIILMQTGGCTTLCWLFFERSKVRQDITLRNKSEH